MNQILNLTIVATLVFLIQDKVNLGGSNEYYAYEQGYGETIINVYEITDDIITESKRVEGYQSINAHNSYAVSDEAAILETISFVEN